MHGEVQQKAESSESRLKIRARIFAWGGAAEHRIIWKLGLKSGHASLHEVHSRKQNHLEVRLKMRARIFAWGGAKESRIIWKLGLKSGHASLHGEVQQKAESSGS